MNLDDISLNFIIFNESILEIIYYSRLSLNQNYIWCLLYLPLKKGNNLFKIYYKVYKCLYLFKFIFMRTFFLF